VIEFEYSAAAGFRPPEPGAVARLIGTRDRPRATVAGKPQKPSAAGR